MRSSAVAETDVSHQDLDSRAAGEPPQGIANQLVRRGRHGDLRVGTDDVAECHGSTRHQLNHQPFRKRLDGLSPADSRRETDHDRLALFLPRIPRSHDLSDRSRRRVPLMGADAFADIGSDFI